jgi:hypothetical protein
MRDRDTKTPRQHKAQQRRVELADRTIPHIRLLELLQVKLGSLRRRHGQQATQRQHKPPHRHVRANKRPSQPTVTTNRRRRHPPPPPLLPLLLLLLLL